MPQRREHPYIWATWLPRLLTGQNSCEWAIWFKAHHQDWTRVPSDFDQSQWLLDHTTLLNEQKALWEERGHDVRVEHQNTFRLRGKAATLAGRPDLVVLQSSNGILIVDVKNGREQPWHAVQVKIYQYALPLVLAEYRGKRIGGEVQYPDHTVRVPRGALDDGFIEDLVSLIRRVASDTPPRRVPSVAECQFCDITAADCPARMNYVADEGAETDDF